MVNQDLEKQEKKQQVEQSRENKEQVEQTIIETTAGVYILQKSSKVLSIIKSIPVVLASITILMISSMFLFKWYPSTTLFQGSSIPTIQPTILPEYTVVMEKKTFLGTYQILSSNTISSVNPSVPTIPLQTTLHILFLDNDFFDFSLQSPQGNITKMKNALGTVRFTVDQSGTWEITINRVNGEEKVIDTVEIVVQ